MNAQIKVISYKKQPPEPPIVVTIGESGGTIGRAVANTCVLPDPDRFISGKHAAISYKNGKFYVTDTSTNGLFFEGDINPLGRDKSVELVDGQKLVVGEYILEVSIEDEPLNLGGSPFDSPAPQTQNQAQTSFFEKEPESKDDFFSEPVERTIPPWQSDEPASNSTGNDFFTSPPTPDFAESKPSGNDFFASDSDLLADTDKPEFTGSSEPDNVPADNQFFSAPNSIPEDWDILSDSEPEVKTEPQPQPEPTFQSEPTPQPMATQPEPVATPAQEPAAPQSFAIPSPGASQPRTQVHAAHGGNSSASMQSFLRGARIEQLNIPETNAEQVLETSGELLRDSLDGLIQMLRARADVKSEFRMEQTTIRAVENNPLKFSVTVDEALRQMLMPTSSAYLPPKEAMHEALNDIEAHQLAIMAGVQAAISAMLKRFEPEQLREQFDQKSGRGLLESKKSWYWEQYEERYKEILTEAEDSFQELFGEAFSKAYQEQVERLSKSRK